MITAHLTLAVRLVDTTTVKDVQLYRGGCTQDEFYRRISDTLTVLSSAPENEAR